MRLAVRLKTILLAIAVVAVSFFVSLKTMDWLSPRGMVRAPVLVELPPLPPAPRSSSIVAPVAIALTAIRDAADRGAPRALAGKADNPVSQILENGDIGWTASRGPITATGAQDVLSLATPLTGTLNVTGSLSSKATGAVGDALSGLLGGNVAKQIGSVSIKALNASAEIKAMLRSPRGQSSPRPGTSSRIWPRRSLWATPAFRWRGRASMSRRRSSR